jgi:hypothetical protein
MACQDFSHSRKENPMFIQVGVAMANLSPTQKNTLHFAFEPVKHHGVELHSRTLVYYPSTSRASSLRLPPCSYQHVLLCSTCAEK